MTIDLDLPDPYANTDALVEDLDCDGYGDLVWVEERSWGLPGDMHAADVLHLDGAVTVDRHARAGQVRLAVHHDLEHILRADDVLVRDASRTDAALGEQRDERKDQGLHR